ncbi:hypothetical protein D1007_13573 [Hordeum vulgare]|nr:hypothetical protein D1007_13573 [Hordeum vulgare]
MENGHPGGGVADPRAWEQKRVASSGCRGLRASGVRRDHDGDDREGCKKTWKEALLGRSRSKELAPTSSSSERQRSPTPTSTHRQVGPGGRHDHSGGATKFSVRATCHSKEPALNPPSKQPRAVTNNPQAPPCPFLQGTMRSRTQDPAASFFEGEAKELPAPKHTYPLALDIKAATAVKTSKPLSFTGEEEEGSAGGDTLDLGPALSLARHTLGVATSHSLQLGVVTSQVCRLLIGEASGSASISRSRQQVEMTFLRPTEPMCDPNEGPIKLFINVVLSVLGEAPLHNKSPRRFRLSPTLTRQSSRQAANPSMVPVSQRARLCLVHDLGILGPREKMMAKAAQALISCFNAPLSEADMATIARLT